MSSVPVSKSYVSKLSKTVKNNPKATSTHRSLNQTENQNKHRGGTLVEQKNGEHFWNDSKIAVEWDIEAVRVHVERKA